MADRMTTESERVEEALQQAWNQACDESIRPIVVRCVVLLIEQARREERERCAKIADEARWQPVSEANYEAGKMAVQIRDAIRSAGDTT